MILGRWAIYSLAIWLLLIGLWNHDWRGIIAALGTLTIWPLISAELPQHSDDPHTERRHSGEDPAATKGKGSS